MSIKFSNIYCPNYNNEVFIKDRVIKTNSTIVIDKSIDIIGDNFIFEDEVIIKSKCSFNYIKFKKRVKIISDYIEVQFNDCIFEEINDKNSINIMGYKSKIVVERCRFINLKTAINLSNKCNIYICNNTFINCRVSLSGVSEVFMKNKDNIKWNSSIGNKNHVFIKGSKFHENIDEFIESVKYLKINNGNCRICFENKKEVIVDTKIYFAENSRELDIALDKVKSGGTIYLKKNKYYGEIEITKSIDIVGEIGTIIEPSIYQINSSAFIIKANNVTISNITIKSSEDIYFRDGITYSYYGGDKCVFNSIVIEGIRRRGISIWGGNTNKTVIKNCYFKGILKGSAISAFAKVDIDNCKFINCETGLLLMFNGDSIVKNSKFDRTRYVITGKKELLKTIKFKANKYLSTNMLINLLDNST